jgi:Spy/CpxP family protein refolding chaperone
MTLWNTRLFSSLIITSVLVSGSLLFASGSADAMCCKKNMKMMNKGCPVSTTMQTTGKCPIIQGWEDAVKLSPEQAVKVDAIRMMHQPERDKLKVDTKAAEEMLRTMMETANTPAAQEAVVAQVKTIGALKTEMDVHHVKESYEIKALLTPEQDKASMAYWKTVCAQKDAKMMMATPDKK